MTKITTTTLAGIAMTAVLLCTFAVQAEVTRHNNGGGIGTVPLVKVAGCLVTGASADFTDDVLLINKGGSTIKAGAKIEWKVPGYGQGTYILVADLSPNGTKHLMNALDFPAHAGEPCSAKVK